MRALITGGTGFIGGALANRLLHSGWEVNLLVRPENRHKLDGDQPYQIFEASLSDNPEILQPALHGCDVVFHAAAIRNRWGTSPEAYWQTNVEGTRRLLFASLGIVPRFVYVSTVGVFGRPGVLGIDESFPIKPEGGKASYHTTKAEAEEMVIAAQEEIDTVIVRPTITYGPGDTDGMVTRLIAMLAKGRFLRVGSGRNHIHLTYIDDLINGLELAGTHPKARNEIFVIAGPAPITIQDLNQLIASMLVLPHPELLQFGIPDPLARAVALALESGDALLRTIFPALGAVPLITRDQINTLTANRGFSSDKAQQCLDYVPRIGNLEGIHRTIDWMIATGRLPHAVERGKVSPSPSGKVYE